MLIRKQDIYSLEIDYWADLPEGNFQTEVANANLDNYSTWLLPQLVAHIGNWRLYTSGRETVVKNCKTPLDKVLWRLTRLKRSQLVKNQTKQPEYAQYTPLLLLALKRSQGYSYEQFREYSGLEWILEPQLYEALVTQENIVVPPRDRLLAIRNQGLLYKTGKNSGTSRNPENTWQLYSIQDTELGSYPKLLQTMMCQCWLAHPRHRRETMILDPNNWDSMPEPLIDSVLVAEPKVPKVATRGELPWLD
jgi:hypothetical protein